MKTILLAVLILAGCAAPAKPDYTTRNCVITVGERVNERSFSAALFCDGEQPVEAPAAR